MCSEYIRKRDSITDKYFRTKCFTCEDIVLFGKTDAGHFIHGNTKLTYFEEDNIHAQCKRCNLWLSGNGTIYTLKMIDKYGRERVDELIKLGKKGHVFNRTELEYWKTYYTDKLKK